MARNRRSRSPTIATTLSFLWPGLGQWYMGHERAAVILAVPVAVGILGFVIWLSAGLESAVVDLVIGPTAAVLALVIVAAGLWRLAAMSHAAWLGGGVAAFRRPATGITFALLGVVVALTHLWAASVSWSLYLGAERVFSPGKPLVVAPGGSSPSPTGVFGAVPPVATPETPESRINILLTGIDAAENRRTTLTDTLIVASIDPVSGDVALISFPRDIARFPTPDGGTFKGKINSLMTYANNHPKQYPQGGLATLVEELGYLLGAPVNYYAAVDLDGFGRLIDAVGGITVNNPRAINDPTYTGWKDGHSGFRLSAGKHKLNGETALAYARSRKGAGDSDFTRSARQQQILLALRQRVTDPSLLPHLPSIISVASETLSTNFPRERIEEMLGLARAVEGDDSVRRVVLGPPYAKNPPAGTPGGYQLVLDQERLARLSIDLFGDQSRYAATH
jgi:LCP family protein required for cell wall assembly